MSDWSEDFLKRWATMVENEDVSAREVSLALELAESQLTIDRLQIELKSGVVITPGTPVELAEEVRKRWKIKDAVIEAAETIYTAVKFEGDRICPHGNTTRYPNHTWYCDDCWRALGNALEEAQI